MTDETLDLAKTIRMVGELPGLRACLLNTTEGLKLAGSLDDPSQEQAISALMPELFEQAQRSWQTCTLAGWIRSACIAAGIN